MEKQWTALPAIGLVIPEKPFWSKGEISGFGWSARMQSAVVLGSEVHDERVKGARRESRGGDESGFEEKKVGLN